MNHYPKIWNLPQYNDDFTGREAQIEEIRNIFERDDTCATKVVISGLPGIGKTQLAKRFAYVNKEKYDVVWWMNAESNLEECYLQLASQLDIITIERRFTDIRYDVLQYLRWYKGGWLLIFDNVDKPEELMDYLPEQLTGNPGHIIITSRDDVYWSKSYQLDPFLLKESKDFLTKITNQIDDISLTKLAERLGNFPLALAHAGAYIRMHDKTYNEYLCIYEDNYTELSKRHHLINSATYTDYYRQTVQTTFLLLLEKIKENSDSIELLLFCSFFNAEKIPKFFLETFISSKKLEFDDVFRPLRKYMILQRDKIVTEGHGKQYLYEDSYSMHRLVLEFINETIPESKKMFWIYKCIDIMKGCFIPDQNDIQKWRHSAALISHLDALLTWTNKYQINNEAVKTLAFNAFNYCSHKDLLELVKKYFNYLKRFMIKINTKNKEFMRLYATYLINWVLFYKATRVDPGDYFEIIDVIDLTFKKNYWKALDDPLLIVDLKYQLACALLELAEQYIKTGMNDEYLNRCEPLLNSILDQVITSQDKRRTIDCLCRLGTLFYVKKQYKQGVDYFIRAHTIHKESGYIYPNMSYAYNALGTLARDPNYQERDLENSKQYYYLSLNEIERMPTLSKTNRYTAWAHYGLSYIFAEQRDDNQSQFHYQKFIENINILFKEWPNSYKQDKIDLEDHIQLFKNDMPPEGKVTIIDDIHKSPDVNAIKILLIENENHTAQYLKKGLSENRFVVDVVDNGDDGLYYALNYIYALIIIDIVTPNLDGWSIIKKIRKNNKSIPIVVISSSESALGKFEALELAVDDYLLKPYVFSELLARIQDLLMRSTHPEQSLILKIADLHIHLKDYKVFRSGKKIKLTKKEFLLLTLLAKYKGEHLSRTFITEQIWDMNFDSDTNFVNVMIRRLRQKIDDSFKIKLIHSVRGVGYILEAR